MVADGGCTHVRVHVRDHEIEQAFGEPLTDVHPLAEVDLLRRVNPRADKAPFPLLRACGPSLGARHHLRDEGVQHRGGRAIGQLRGSEGILIGGKVQLDAVNEVVVDQLVADGALVRWHLWMPPPKPA